ncbi:MAG: hypothetical protein BWY80_00826 [Firmicutes bacterium ADurb.Bin456]|nr:MAG: hypothetical protein BWY80_00826 [Firmicutes bacterium ADurb.Bin456]
MVLVNHLGFLSVGMDTVSVDEKIIAGLSFCLILIATLTDALLPRSAFQRGNLRLRFLATAGMASTFLVPRYQS